MHSIEENLIFNFKMFMNKKNVYVFFNLLFTWAFFIYLLSSSSSNACNHTSRCLNPGVNGLKAFTAIKRARLIPDSIFSIVHTRYAHVHTWRANNHYFWSPVLILLFTIERFVAVQLKTEHVWHKRCLFSVHTHIHVSSRAIFSLIVTLVGCPLVPTCRFYPVFKKPNSKKEEMD